LNLNLNFLNNSSKHFRGVFYSVTAALMWGILAIVLKVSLRDLSSFSIVWARFSIAFLILFCYIVIKQPSALTIFLYPPKKLIIASICLGFNYYGFMKGVEYTTPGNAAVFIQLAPVLFALAGIYIFKEKIYWKHILGFTIVICGLGLFYREQLLAMANQKSYSIGILWVVAGAITWAVYAIYMKDLSLKRSTHQLNIFIYGFGTLIFSPMPEYNIFLHLSLVSWLLVLFLGLSTLVAYGAIAMAFRYLDSSKVSVIITMNPILTFILMYIFGRMNVSWIAMEHFSTVSILGAALALSGAVFVILFTKRE
jgi:drug/metabolite transporter (DMT)-like permease